MKALVLSLPALMMAALIAGLYVAPPRELTPSSCATPATQIHTLREQRNAIDARLDVLESQRNVFLPRGMGRISAAPYRPAPGTAAPTALPSSH